MNRPIVAAAAAFAVVFGLWRLLAVAPEGEPEGEPGEAGPVAPARGVAEGLQPDLEAPAAPAELSGIPTPQRVTDPRPAGTPEPEPPVVASPEADVVLAGFVVDGGGIGVPDATVTAERHVTDSGGFGLRSFRVDPLPELTARTDSYGRFEVRGGTGGAVVVRAAKGGSVLQGEVNLTLPATNAMLVLEPAGSLEVTVAPAARDLAGLVDVEGRRDDRAEVAGSFDEGRALLAPLWPSSYDVVLRGRTSRRVLHTVTGVTVSAGEVTRDPRLQDLDLRLWARAVRVTVVDPEGEPISGATAWVDHGYGETGVPTGTDGSIVLAAGSDGVDVAVRESGWRAARHVAVTEDLVVRLERPLTLRLVRPAGRSEELGDLYLHVARVVAEGEPPAAGGNNDWLLSARQASVDVDVDRPGVYRVQWAASVAIPGSGSLNVFPQGATHQEIVVTEATGTQEVPLALDPAVVEEVLARVIALRTELARQPGETDEEHAQRVMQAALRAYRD